MRLTTSPPSRADCHEIWEPKPPGTLWATPALLRDSFTFTFTFTTTVVARGVKLFVLNFIEAIQLCDNIMMVARASETCCR